MRVQLRPFALQSSQCSLALLLLPLRCGRLLLLCLKFLPRDIKLEHSSILDSHVDNALEGKSRIRIV